MKKAALVIVSVVGIGIVSCSGAPSNPADACDQAMTALCNKIYSCVDAQTIKNTLGYTSLGDCITKWEATANCVNKMCPQGTTFNSSNASTCVNDINTEACNQMTNVPGICGQLCQ